MRLMTMWKAVAVARMLLSAVTSNVPSSRFREYLCVPTMLDCEGSFFSAVQRNSCVWLSSPLLSGSTIAEPLKFETVAAPVIWSMSVCCLGGVPYDLPYCVSFGAGRNAGGSLFDLG